MDVKYSFIVPVYNVGLFMPICIESILAQTYQQYEIIIVDDGSPDSCGQIADEYHKKYPEKIIAIHQANTGQGGARNHGVEVARGEYILFVDGDDYVAPNMLDIIEKYNKEHKDDILIFEWETARERVLPKPEAADYIGEYSTLSLSEYVLQQPSPWRKVYRATLFKNKQLRFPEKIFYEDLSLAPCFVKDVRSIGVINEKLYYYVQHRSSTMRSKDINRILDIIPAFDYILDFFRRNGLYKQYYDELEWLAIQHVLYYSIVRIFYVEYNASAACKLTEYVKNVFPNYKENVYIEAANKHVNYEELQVLLNEDYEQFDCRFYRFKRFKGKIKDTLRTLFTVFPHPN